eukprot:TRINITY_DN15755_c0_g1_i1.p1 TRINITY_DN15755_c0_g1~~TRINITY_DN15755_c0_g1_i1.p1  ORF type:complete len:209 (+),score=41.59 TRINITY_DN15755_c0_g1_i1:91-717(+)
MKRRRAEIDDVSLALVTVQCGVDQQQTTQRNEHTGEVVSERARKRPKRSALPQALGRKTEAGTSYSLEEHTRRVVEYLQVHGAVQLTTIREELGIDARRSYDIVNVLLETPLVSSKSENKKDQLLQHLDDATVVPEAYNIVTLLDDIRKEQQAAAGLLASIEHMQTLLSNQSSVQPADTRTPVSTATTAITTTTTTHTMLPPKGEPHT